MIQPGKLPFLNRWATYLQRIIPKTSTQGEPPQKDSLPTECLPTESSQDSLNLPTEDDLPTSPERTELPAE
jgi:hypothetical protein